MPKLITAFQDRFPGVDIELLEFFNDLMQKYLTAIHSENTDELPH